MAALLGAALRNSLVGARIYRVRKKRRICHPERALFAGEGSAIRQKARKKQIPNPVQKPNVVRNDIFSSFFRSLFSRVR
jgi:hypothetical protein